MCIFYFDIKYIVIKCRNLWCGICDYIIEGFKYDFSGKEFIVKMDMLCDIKNVLYVIICLGCNEYYIGEISNLFWVCVCVYK